MLRGKVGVGSRAASSVTAWPLVTLEVWPEPVAMLPYSPGRTVDIWALLRLPKAGGPDAESSPARTRPSQRRMGAAPAMRSTSVPNRGTIISLIVVAAALLDSELQGRCFTFEQLVNKMRELPGRDLGFDVVDVQAVLPGMGHCLAQSRDGWQWKRRCREPGYL
jgi:hypothetical protein